VLLELPLSVYEKDCLIAFLMAHYVCPESALQVPKQTLDARDDRLIAFYMLYHRYVEAIELHEQLALVNCMTERLAFCFTFFFMLLCLAHSKEREVLISYARLMLPNMTPLSLSDDDMAIEQGLVPISSTLSHPSPYDSFCCVFLCLFVCLFVRLFVCFVLFCVVFCIRTYVLFELSWCSFLGKVRFNSSLRLTKNRSFLPTSFEIVMSRKPYPIVGAFRDVVD
jgi:hypothetical protein